MDILPVFDCFALLLTDVVLNLVVFVCVGVCSCLSAIARIRKNINNEAKKRRKKKHTPHILGGLDNAPDNIPSLNYYFNDSKLFPRFV